MKTRKLVLIVSSVLLPQMALADNVGNYKYDGDSTARQICKAIVLDDAKKLKRLLHSYRSSRVNSYHVSTREMSQDFSCNEMDLDQFSYYMGAQKVSSYLTETDFRNVAATTE